MPLLDSPLVPRPGPAVAYFVSAHGFGHAARAAAVIEALVTALPGLRLEVFTTVPEWFFAESLSAPFAYHRLEVDVGLEQRTALAPDLEATVRRLERFLPFAPATLDPLARTLETLNCRAVVCDVSPLGLAAARRAAVPAVLVENFTWDWIYDGYAEQCRPLATFADLLRSLFSLADLHLQTTPVCRPCAGARTTAPVSRKPRTAPEDVRRLLGVPRSAPLVLLTMGGIPWQHGSLVELERHPELFFVVPGAADRVERRGRLVALPHHSPFFHPDLVRASDAVVGKLGYSTLAEVLDAGCALGFIPRPGFPESPLLARFAKAEMPALALEADTLETGAWRASLTTLLTLPRRPPGRARGAETVAAMIAELLG